MQPTKSEIHLSSQKTALKFRSCHNFFQSLILILIDTWLSSCLRSEMDHATFTLPGRRSSWVSWWHALFSTAKDGDISGTPQGFLESGSAKVSNTSVKSSLLTFVRYPIDCVSKRSKPKSPTPPSQFEALPRGFILEMTQYLSLSSGLSLSYACRSFRHKVEARVEDLDYLIEIESFSKDPKESRTKER